MWANAGSWSSLTASYSTSPLPIGSLQIAHVCRPSPWAAQTFPSTRNRSPEARRIRTISRRLGPAAPEMPNPGVRWRRTRPIRRRASAASDRLAAHVSRDWDTISETDTMPRVLNVIIRVASSGAGEAEGVGVAPPGVEVAAILPMAGGVLGRGEQQAVAIARGGVAVVVEQADAQLLVVRVVARLHRAHREGLHQRAAVGAGAQVRGRPVHGLEGAEAVERAVQTPQQLGRGERVGALGRLDLHRVVAGRVFLVVRGPGDEGGGHEQELEAVRVLEGVEEPAHRVAVFVAVLRHRVRVGIAGLHDELGGGELDGVDDLAMTLARLEQGHDQIDEGRLLPAEDRVLQRQRLHRSEVAVVGEQLAVAIVEQVLHDLAAHLVR